MHQPESDEDEMRSFTGMSACLWQSAFPDFW